MRKRLLILPILTLALCRGCATTETPSTGEVEQAEPLLPVTLLPALEITASTLQLAWTISQDQEFDHYSLLRGDVPEVTAESDLVLAEFEDSVQVTYSDSELSSETSYYYRVMVTDTQGRTVLSNEIVATTLGAPEAVPPTPVVLFPPIEQTDSSITLTWSENRDEDFEAYDLLRRVGPGVTTENGETIVQQPDPSQVSFRDEAVEPNRSYYYRVLVTDTEGLMSLSNEVSGTTTSNTPPDPVILEDPTEITGTGMTLTWSASESGDFARYRLLRALSPTFGDEAEQIYEAPNQDTLSFSDSGLRPDTTYYYRLYVVDSWGVSNGSNTVQGLTLDTEIPTCVIERSHSWSEVDSPVVFTAVGCRDNLTPEEEIQVRWDFGDGSIATEYSAEKSVTYAFPARGAYWVELEVTDGSYDSVSSTPIVVGEVVQLEGGQFNMGRDVGATPWPDMHPSRIVTTDEFWIHTFEVTSSEYAAFLSDGNSGHYFGPMNIADNMDGTYTAELGEEEHPSSGANWYESSAYCAWAGMRLPTEAEWEHAARGPATGTNYSFPWGQELPESIDPAPANYGDIIGDLVDVVNYPNGVTAWAEDKAVYQMAGNITEWVSDLYDPDYYLWANENEDNVNPTGPAESPFIPDEPGYRVTRGGGLNGDANVMRVSFRTFHDPYQGGIGFRCATNVLP